MRSWPRKTLSILICIYKMENSYKTLRMPELKALAREHELRGCSRSRKAELIAFLQNNERRAQRPLPPPPQTSTWEPNRPPQMSTWEPNWPPQMSTWEPNRPPWMSTWEPNWPPQMSPSGAPPRGASWELEREWENELRQPELEALTKRQLKRRRNRDSKLAKKFKNVEKENDNLKSQMEELEDKIAKPSKSADARFKRKKIRSMKREANKIAEKLRESEKALKLLEPRVPKDQTLKRHPSSRNKHIEAKIAEINKKIRRAKNRRNKERLIAK